MKTDITASPGEMAATPPIQGTLGGEAARPTLEAHAEDPGRRVRTAGGARSHERVLVVHNPRAGDSSPSARSLLAMLSEAGYQARYRTSDDAWREELAAFVDLVVVVGGDGTVGPVAMALGDQALPFAVLPVGTANNIAKTFDITGDARDVVAAWALGEPRPFDVWTATAGDRATRFVESIGAGPLVPPMADPVDRAERMLPLGGPIDRALHACRTALAAAPVERWHIEADGQDLSGDYIGFEAMNIRSVGPNLPLAPEGDPGDRWLDLVLMRESDREPLRAQLHAAATARPTGPFELPTYHCADVRVVPPSAATTLHVDGALWPAGRGPHQDEIRVRQTAQALIVPSRAGPTERDTVRSGTRL